MARQIQISFLFFLLFAVSGQAQILEGTVSDASGETLPYVNIGVVDKNIGTVSGENGKFKLAVPESYIAETIRFSMLGYDALGISVSDLRAVLSKNPEIKLQPSQIQLQEVTVSKTKLKEKILGNKTESQTTNAGFSSNKLGNEIGIVIKIKKAPTFIKNFTASVASEQSVPIKLRLNFYSLKDGLPDQLLQDKNIIVTAPVVNGKLTIDLSDYNIMVEDDFFVGLEWIENGPGQGIKFSAALFGSPLIARETSQGTWEKVGFVGIGFTVTARY